MDYDVIILGSGPAGHHLAIKLGTSGKNVLIVEKDELGGTCTNVGCIPTKAFRAMAKKQEVSDISSIRKHVTKAVKLTRMGVKKLLNDANVEVKSGFGKIMGKNTIDVEGETYTAETIVLATGTRSKNIGGISADHGYIVDNTSILEIEKIPENLLVIGAGFIGLEYASIFKKLGSKVTIVDALDEIMMQEDHDVRDFINQKILTGIEVKLHTYVKQIKSDAGEILIENEHGTQSINADLVLLAAGRKTNIEEIGLGTLGVELDGDFIKVDESMKTNIDNVYALGDVTGGYMLAHKASMQAEICGKKILGEKIYYPKHVPWVLFTFPPVAHAGLTEEEAKIKKEITVGISQYAANGKAISLGKRQGFVKSIIEKNTGKILGIHIVGSQADSLIGEAVMLVEKEITAQDAIQVIHPHPTLTEMIPDSLKDALKKI